MWIKSYFLICNVQLQHWYTVLNEMEMKAKFNHLYRFRRVRILVLSVCDNTFYKFQAPSSVLESEWEYFYNTFLSCFIRFEHSLFLTNPFGNSAASVWQQAKPLAVTDRILTFLLNINFKFIAIFYELEAESCCLNFK